MNTKLSMLISALSCAPCLFAGMQDSALPQSAPHAIQDFDWRVPIHTMPADPTFGAYGTWAAGRGYKVSFHDGMRFFPVLGADAPHNLPLSWQTASVRCGAIELLAEDARATHHHDDWRYEYRTTHVAEIYDVRADGVEQSFVIARPQGPLGDLEVTGRVATSLRAELRPIAGTSRTAIAYLDADDREVLRYGGAIAFDATGRRVDVTTSLRGDGVVLTVPAAWVHDAVWPITIDPLLSAQLLVSVSSLGIPIEESDVVVTLGGPTAHRVLTTFSIPVSMNDFDCYSLLSDPNFQNPRVVFADVSSTLRTDHARAAFVDQAGPTGRFAIAITRASFGSGSPVSQVRVWLHDGGSLTFQGGSMIFLPTTTFGWNDRNPDIGGSRNDDRALLVYESDLPNAGDVSDDTELHRVFVDVDAGVFGAPSRLDPTPIGTAFDRANPSVNQTSDGAPLSWVVCYQQRPVRGNSDWSIRGRRISTDGTASATATIVDALPGEPVHELEPSVDGGNTRYAVSYLLADSGDASSGSKLGMTRFHWTPSGNSPTVQWSSIVDTADALALQSIDDARVVYDPIVGHWAVAYHRRAFLFASDRLLAARVGFNGAVVETQTVHSSLSTRGVAPSIAYDSSNRRFLLGYGTTDAAAPVFGRAWTYPANATNSLYGTSCGGSFGAVSLPLVGTEFFRVRLTGARPNAPAVLWVGFQPATLDLGVIGMNGCRLLVDPSPLVSFPTTTDASGDGLVTISHLLDPLDLYMQWAHVTPGSNPLGVSTTEGMVSRVR